MIQANTPIVAIQGKPARQGIRHENGVSYYPMARLAFRDGNRVFRILQIGAMASGRGISQVDVGNVENLNWLQAMAGVADLLLAALGHADQEIAELFGKLLNIDPKYFDDPDYMPLDAQEAIIYSFCTHPDFAKLVETVGKRMGAMSATQSATSPAPLTPSADDTGGPTTPS